MIVIFFICYYSVSTSASVADANKKTNVVAKLFRAAADFILVAVCLSVWQN